MAAAALCISALAMITSGVALVYSRQGARAARQQLRVRTAQQHSARTPRLTMTRVSEPGPPVVIYSVRNDSPLYLYSVVVHRPVDSIYPVSSSSTDARTNDAEVDIGPVASGQERRFHLTVGPAPSPIPNLRVVIDCLALGEPPWRLAPVLLETPWRRPPPQAVDLA